MSRDSRHKDVNYSRDDRRPQTFAHLSSLDSRICIGNIDMRNLTSRDIYEWMKHYGKVLDIVFFERHLLVQFDRESDARRAIDRERGQTFRGSRFDIRFAFASDGRMSRRSDASRSNSPRQLQNNRNSRDRIQESPATQDRSNKNEYPPQESRRNERRESSDEVNRSRFINQHDNDRPRKDIQAPKLESAQLRDIMESNRPGFDAAIIIMSNELLNYAETIESYINRQIGLKTIIILLKEESHVNACVEDLNTKGVLYAFLINEMNQKFYSCTLRILYGTLQEHRNMPLNNAISFVALNFDNYQKQIRQSKPVIPSKLPPGFIPPDDNLSYNLYLLADNQTLTLEELNHVTEFVDNRIHALTNAAETVDKPLISGIPAELVPNNGQYKMSKMPETYSLSGENVLQHQTPLRSMIQKHAPNPSSKIGAPLKTTEPRNIYNGSTTKSNMNISSKPQQGFNTTVQSQFKSNNSQQNISNKANYHNASSSKNKAPFNQYSMNLSPNMRQTNDNSGQQRPTTQVPPGQGVENDFHGYQQPQSGQDRSYFPPGSQYPRY